MEPPARDIGRGDSDGPAQAVSAENKSTEKLMGLTARFIGFACLFCILNKCSKRAAEGNSPLSCYCDFG
jgi:hypothetical protein